MSFAAGSAGGLAGSAGGFAHARSVDPAALRDVAVEVARRAGELVAARAHEHLQADTKSTPTDAVTDVDRASEALIVSLLAELRPGDGVLGEEGANRPSTTGVRWVVDPLDGTVNYLYGLGAYAVSIAAELDGDASDGASGGSAVGAGLVVAGAVFDVARGVMYEAYRGGGARRDGVALRCSEVSQLGLSLVGTGFGYAAQVRAEQGQIVARLLPQVRDIRRVGSAALDLCAVASGALDAYYERGIHPWDRAAGLLMAREAGASWAVVPEADGRELTVVSAPGVFDPLLHAVA